MNAFHFFALICAYISPQPTQSARESNEQHSIVSVSKVCEPSENWHMLAMLAFLKTITFCARSRAHWVSCTSQKPQRTANFCFGKEIQRTEDKTILACTWCSSVSEWKWISLSFWSAHREYANQVGLSCCCCCTVFVRQIACLSVVLCAAPILSLSCSFSNPRSK